MRDLGAQRVAFTSPYVTQLADEAVDFIQQCGIEVVNQVGFDKELSSLEQNALTPQDAYQMGLKADHPQAEPAGHRVYRLPCPGGGAGTRTGAWQTGCNE